LLPPPRPTHCLFLFGLDVRLDLLRLHLNLQHVLHGAQRRAVTEVAGAIIGGMVLLDPRADLGIQDLVRRRAELEQVRTGIFLGVDLGATAGADAILRGNRRRDEERGEEEREDRAARHVR